MYYSTRFEFNEQHRHQSSGTTRTCAYGDRRPLPKGGSVIRLHLPKTTLMMRQHNTRFHQRLRGPDAISAHLHILTSTDDIGFRRL